MAKYRVNMQTIASTSIEIEVPDDVTDLEEITERAFNEANFPTLCAQCSGWGKDYSLDLGDEWDVSEYNGEPLIERVAT